MRATQGASPRAASAAPVDGVNAAAGAHAQIAKADTPAGRFGDERRAS
jgi:hypothetical protein